MSKTDNSTDGKVIDFNEIRQAKIEEKRRKYERVVFKNVLGAYCAAEGDALKAVELVDLSTTGMSFQLPSTSKNLDSVKLKKEYVFRMYFSEDTYVPIHVVVQNKRPCVENGGTYYRFGCTVDTTTKGYETYSMFVQFLQKYAETAQQDNNKTRRIFF